MLVGAGEGFFSDPQMQTHRIVVLNDASSVPAPTQWRALNMYRLPAYAAAFIELRVHHWSGGEDVLTSDQAVQCLDDPE